MKWPPSMDSLTNSIDYQDIIEPKFIRYMKKNNFKYEEIQYILTMLNTFCFLNKPRIEEDGQRLE